MRIAALIGRHDGSPPHLERLLTALLGQREHRARVLVRLEPVAPEQLALDHGAAIDLLQFLEREPREQVRHARIRREARVRDQRRAPVGLERAQGLFERVVEELVGRVLERTQRELGRARAGFCAAEVREPDQGLEAHARVLVGDPRREQLEGACDPVSTVPHDARRRGARAEVLGGQQALEQRAVDRPVGRLEPQGLEPVVLAGLARGPARAPGPGRLDHLGRCAPRQLDARPVAHAVGRVGEKRDELVHRPPGDRRRLDLGAALPVDAVHAPVLDVAAGVAQVVLHVPDQRVVPVEEIDRTVGPDLDVDRAEVGIRAEDDRLELLGAETRAVVEHAVLEDALKTDHVGHQVVALVLLGEVRAREDLGPAAGPRALLEEREVARVAGGKVEVAAEGQRVVVHVAGAVGHEVLAPAVEHVPVRVGEAVGDVAFDAARARLEAPDTATAVAQNAVDRLDLAHVEGALLEVEGAVGTEDEAVGGVVGVGGREAVQDALAPVCAVVAVGVLEEQDVGAVGDQHAAVPELEPGRVVQVLGEDRRAVGAAVAVDVLEDHELVVHRLARLPVGVGRPASDPEAPARVPGHLHRVGELGEALLAGEEPDLQALGGGHPRQGLLAREEGVRAGPVGRDRDLLGHRDGRRGVGVLAAGDSVDAQVGAGAQGVEHVHLALHHLEVAEALRVPLSARGDRLGVAQRRAPAVDVVSVGHAVAVEPQVVLGPHFGAQALLVLGAELGGFWPEQCHIDRARELSLSRVVQMDAIDRQALVGRFVPGSQRGEEVDERDLEPAGHARCGRVVERDTGVVLDTVREGAGLGPLVAPFERDR